MTDTTTEAGGNTDAATDVEDPAIVRRKPSTSLSDDNSTPDGPNELAGAAEPANS